MRRISHKHTPISAPGGQVRHVEDRVDGVDCFRLGEALGYHRIRPAFVPFAEGGCHLLRVGFRAAGWEVGVEEGEEDDFVGGGLGQAAVAEGSCWAVDEGDAWVGEVDLWERGGFGEVEDAADGAVAAVCCCRWLVMGSKKKRRERSERKKMAGNQEQLTDTPA
jgi:hypothetical protein